MQIQITTDSNIQGREKLTAYVRGVVEGALSRFNNRITRLEVHLSDENGHKTGQDDKRCMMEAHVAGLQTTAATHQAATLDHAIDGAVDRLKRSLDSALERRRDHR